MHPAGSSYSWCRGHTLNTAALPHFQMSWVHWVRITMQSASKLCYLFCFHSSYHFLIGYEITCFEMLIVYRSSPDKMGFPGGSDGKESACNAGVQFSSVAQLCPTLCDPMNRSMPGLPVHHQLPEFTQTHDHWVSDAIQPSHPLSSPSPPAPNPSQHQGLF